MGSWNSWVRSWWPVTASTLGEYLAPVHRKLETIMSQTSELLDQVATGLTTLGQPIADLIAENAAQAAKIAELEDGEVAESAAADRVKVAFDDIAGKFTATPNVPDVPPLPDPAPADGGDTSGTDTGDGSTTV